MPARRTSAANRVRRAAAIEAMFAAPTSSVPPMTAGAMTGPL